MPAPSARADSAGDWWQDAVVYQIYPRSFADANGDGMGDLPGVRSRLGYLSELGVDAIWLSPFYPSPLADGGYDITDHRSVDPRLGTLTDFDALVADAHQRGLKMIIDIVPNHTSDQHPWFLDALRAGPRSPERERYIFRDGTGPGGSQPPSDWRSHFGGPAWHRTADGQWYCHLFAREQPDLNWEHPDVRADFERTLRFWFDRGVDGFRIDVAHGLAKDPAMPDVGDDGEEILEPTKRLDHPFWDRDEVHDVYRGWREVVDAYPGDRVLVAEAWVASAERRAAYLRHDELHTAFNFDFLRADWDADVLHRVVDECIAAESAVGATTTWVLANHDVVREVTRYGDGEKGLARARAAALLMLALPGGAYVYQGEELGLPEVLDLPESVLADPTWERSGHTVRGRDGCRVPIPWTTDGPSLGFGPGPSWLPQPAYFADLSVQAQAGEDRSTLELFRSALRHRRALAVETEVDWLPSPAGSLAFRRRCSDGSTLVCVVACTGESVELPPYDEVLVSSEPVTTDSQGRAVLPGDATAWLRTR